MRLLSRMPRSKKRATGGPPFLGFQSRNQEKSHQKSHNKKTTKKLSALVVTHARTQKKSDRWAAFSRISIEESAKESSKESQPPRNKPRVLLFDVFLTPITSYFFDLTPQKSHSKSATPTLLSHERCRQERVRWAA